MILEKMYFFYVLVQTDFSRLLQTIKNEITEINIVQW
jgi:hypothetical protein